MSDTSLIQHFAIPERAELLGAIYGDGYIQRRSQYGYKVAVTSSDDYPEWLARIPELFEIVFGRPPFHYERRVGKGRSRPHHDFYVTCHNLYGQFRVHGKYDEQGRLLPPPWVDGDAELRRRFLRGLVETDGMFKVRSDARRVRARPEARFSFAQRCPALLAWVENALLDAGFTARHYFGRASGVGYVTVNRQDQVRRLGEWLESFKWKALVESGYGSSRGRLNRKTGEPMAPREAEFWPNIDQAEQERWREWRELGASIVAIARHVGRSNSVIQHAVQDIVPSRATSPHDLGLRPQPRYPRKVPRDEVDEWRKAVCAGESARKVAARFERKASQVVEATRDIVYDRDA